MKIREAIINIENVFTNYKIKFNTINSTHIYYLVGNNGAGKTILLEALYNCIVNKPNARIGSVKLMLTNITNDNSLVYHDPEITMKWPSTHGFNSTEIQGKTSKGGKYAEFPKGQAIKLRNAIFTTAEINFNDYDIVNLKPITIDEETPTDQAKDLHTLIPDMLASIENQDNRAFTQWYDKYQNKANKSQPPIRKLDRFKSAYNIIFNGEKTFEGIEIQNNSYQVLFKNTKTEKTIFLKNLSTGEKQVIYRIGYILKNMETIANGTIFIDEPELSLHPLWQANFKKLLLGIFEDSQVQIIIATHSPYIIGDMNPRHEECIIIDHHKSEAETVKNLSVLESSASPSINLVNYLAYGISSVPLHIELFTELQIHSGTDNITNIDNWLENCGLEKENRSVSGGENFASTNRSSMETKPIWIRNKIHHSDNKDRKDYIDEDLKTSIDQMINLLASIS